MLSLAGRGLIDGVARSRCREEEDGSVLEEGGLVDEGCGWKRFGESTTYQGEEGTCDKAEAEELEVKGNINWA